MKGRLERLVTEGIKPALRPGEELETAAYSFASPIPYWLVFVFEGALVWLIMTPYFVGLTPERLVFMRVSRLTTKRSSFAFDVPREQATVKRFRKGILWSRLTLQTPERKLRLRFAWNLRNEAEQLANALRDESAPSGIVGT
jgi:hypothetical protein